MTEYFPETKTYRKILCHNEYFEVEFNVKNPGTINISTWAQWDHTFPMTRAHRKIELFKPDESKPVKSKTDNTSGTMTLSYNISASELDSNKNWTARVTSMEKDIECLYLQISYPGDFLMKSIVIPLSELENFFNSTICKTKICMCSGENASFVIFPKNLGISNVFFVIPHFKQTINMRWPTSKINLQQHANSINSSNITFSLENASPEFPRGFIRFVVHFEEMGAEITGTYHCHLNNMQLAIDIGLKMQEHKISYDHTNIRVNFSFNLEILGITKKLENYIFNPISNYTDHIKQIVENTVRNIFKKKQMRHVLSTSITRLVTPFLGDNPSILTASIEDNQFIVRYFNLNISRMPLQ